MGRGGDGDRIDPKQVERGAFLPQEGGNAGIQPGVHGRVPGAIRGPGRTFPGPDQQGMDAPEVTCTRRDIGRSYLLISGPGQVQAQGRFQDQLINADVSNGCAARAEMARYIKVGPRVGMDRDEG